ncbi:FkbM family methyltransferase (plasmid) [Azospirillum brasilense]|uniref:FkbM family methyltransferase n=1 Tax=Azospirillum brasilense TaxID=192 RepID=A0A4D8RAW7_AZOBR|nr:FkbM family methyltransferase [Azospirillum brasilense]QCO19937.1 FkbM family methyltransferase [Azospirillum brasilense]
MTFVSYAQNYEDVMLFRALKGVEKGFYIDVGANDPIEYSMTKAFYDRGWRGINIEPIDSWYERLCADRPEDINLKVAVSDQPGILKLFEVLGSGLSTASSGVADRHRESGFETRECFVPALTLESICRDYGVGDIHFLKVDVEGAEPQVLASIALETFRPWIIVVEATAPMSEEENHHLWSSLLTDRGYDQVYFDGLNQFYVAREHAELGEAFRKPPNVFDRFVPHELVIARDHCARVAAELDHFRKLAEDRGEQSARLAGELDHFRRLAEERGEHGTRIEAELDRFRRRAEELEPYVPQLEQAQERVTVLEAELARVSSESRHWWTLATELTDNMNALRSSLSWRLTKPLRFLRRILSGGRARIRRGLIRTLGALARRAAAVVRWWMPGLFRVMVKSSLVRRIYARANRPIPTELATDGVAAVSPSRSELAVTAPDNANTLTLLTHAMRGWELGRRIDG